MREHPIFFSGTMVKAILEGRKTMTRRPLKPQPPPYLEGRSFRPITDNLWGAFAVSGTAGACRGEDTIRCPYGIPGDRLWVREGFAKCPTTYKPNGIIYRADGEDDHVTSFEWRPSIFMPRSLSRITLEITNVGVESLKEITEEDCDREVFGGYIPHVVLPEYGFHGGMTIKECFAVVWDSIYCKNTWSLNLWVWVIEFRRLP